MAPGATEEVARAASGFVGVMRQQPLALALVIMNFVLLGYLFYVSSSTTLQRKETTELIVNWQKDSDKLLANCVSGEITRLMFDNIQRITDTMLGAEQKEIARMQTAIDAERQRSWELRERQLKPLENEKKSPELKPQDNSFRRMSLPLPEIPNMSPALLINLHRLRK